MTVKARATLKTDVSADISTNATGNISGNEVRDHINHLADSALFPEDLPGVGNSITNGAFDIWQRGTSFTPTTVVFMADRWQGRRGSNAAGGTWSRQDGFSGATYCTRIARNSGNTAVDIMHYGQQIHSVQARQLRGKSVTLSAYARKGANWSDADSSLAATIFTGTGTDEAAATLTGGFATGNVSHVLTPQLVAASEARLTYPAVTLAAGLNEIMINFNWLPVGTAGAADYLEITKIKLAVGASDFVHRTEKQEMDECLYFYEEKTVRSESGNRHIPLVRKRIVPSISVGVGTALVITVDGFEHNHSAAATFGVVASAEF